MPLAASAARAAYRTYRRAAYHDFGEDDAVQEGYVKLVLLLRADPDPAAGLVRVAVTRHVMDRLRGRRGRRVEVGEPAAPAVAPFEARLAECLEAAPPTVRDFVTEYVSGGRAAMYARKRTHYLANLAQTRAWLADHWEG